MENKGNYFSRANKLFWGLIIVIIIFSIFNFNSGIFKSDDLAKDIIRNDSLSKINWDDKIVENDTLNIQIDTARIPNDTIRVPNDTIEKKFELETSEWNWSDFNGKMHRITFSFPKNSIANAQQNRLQYTNYGPLYENDKTLLKDLINKMKVDIKRDNLDYMETLEYVCSSIQYIPYTLILSSSGIEYPPNSNNYVKCPCQTNFGFFNNNCDYKTDNGCCNDVNPFGVYSPFEFAFKKTGDCDTRALLAFTLLKEMGFQVAVMVSKSKHHSVLGVYLPNSYDYSVGHSLNGKKYVLWELTNPDWRLGQRVEGDDWKADLE
jgi:hypothetical protein